MNECKFIAAARYIGGKEAIQVPRVPERTGALIELFSCPDCEELHLALGIVVDHRLRTVVFSGRDARRVADDMAVTLATGMQSA